MRKYSKKTWKPKRSASKVNHLRLESLEPRLLLSYDTLPNGMPILHSHPLGANAPAAIFLDFDGDAGSGLTPYSDDADPTTFNAAEQAGIYEVWRYTAAFYSMFDVDVTTIQPNVATQPTAWHVISSGVGGGGLAYGSFPSTVPISYSGAVWTVHGMATVAVHEVGHNFGCAHIWQFDTLGQPANDNPALFVDDLHGGIMGGGGATIDKWVDWHYEADGNATLQEEVGMISGLIRSHSTSADGFRPDDYGGDIAHATALTVSGTTQSATGIIERMTDADAFSFTASTAGRYAIATGREFGSGVDLKLSLYDSAGTLIAAEDGDPHNQPYSLVNDQYLTADLAAGTYYVILAEPRELRRPGAIQSPRRSAARGLESGECRLERHTRLCHVGVEQFLYLGRLGALLRQERLLEHRDLGRRRNGR